MEKVINIIIADIATITVFLFGGLDIALQCLLVAIVLDYISGLIKAFSTKTLSSRIGARGILKKVAILAIVVLAVQLDRISGSTGSIRTLVIYYFVANEGLSIIENLAVSGVPIPKKLKKALKLLKDSNK